MCLLVFIVVSPRDDPARSAFLSASWLCHVSFILHWGGKTSLPIVQTDILSTYKTQVTLPMVPALLDPAWVLGPLPAESQWPGAWNGLTDHASISYPCLERSVPHKPCIWAWGRKIGVLWHPKGQYMQKQNGQVTNAQKLAQTVCVPWSQVLGFAQPWFAHE